MHIQETPWSAILDYLKGIGSERSSDGLLEAAISRIRSLVSYDFAQAVFLDEETHRFSRMRSVDLPDSFAASYPLYFDSQRGRFSRTRMSGNDKLFRTTSKPFMRTAFGAEWVKPLGVEHSAGIAIDGENGRCLALLILYRSGRSMGFASREMAIFSLIEPLISNLFFCLRQGRRAPAMARVEDEVEGFPQLTPREREIVAELCKGSATRDLSDRLYISPNTLYRHINNVYEKLEVSNRQALIAKVLRTF
jgi:DNA-binding CsgD family transcriptional regulator